MCRSSLHGGRRCPGHRTDGGAARRARAREAQARYRARTAQSGTSTNQFLTAVADTLDPAQLAAQWQRQLRTLSAAGIDTTPAVQVARDALTTWRTSTHTPGAPTGHGTVRGAYEHRTPWRDDPARLSRSSTAEAARSAVDAALRTWIAEQTARLDEAELVEAGRKVKSVQNTNLLTDEEMEQARRAAEERTARVQAEQAPIRAAQEARRRAESNLRMSREMCQNIIRSRLADAAEKAAARQDFIAALTTWAESAEPSPGFMADLTTWAKRDKLVRPAWLTVRARQLDGDLAAAQAELTGLTRRRRA